MPESPAIIEAAPGEEPRVTSFRELFEQAASLALQFVEHGVQRQDRIALVLPKTTEAIVSLFASLLAGAIYVPIHPQWPKERIDATLTDCSARLAIENADDSVPRVTDRVTGGFIPWPAETSSSRDFSKLGSLRSTDAREPALILFTSGSTGQPKGVLLSHRAVSSFVRWTANEFQISSADRIACPSPLSFDLSTFDIFNMALRGATCVLIRGHSFWMPRFLVQFLREAGITCWYSVPSILAGMLEEGRLSPQDCPDLRLILFAGEVFRSHYVSRLKAAAPKSLCVNLYGPTETNVVTWYRVPEGFDGSRPLPIGQPCPYATAAIDPSTGEMLAGGDSLMTEYWNRPEDTQRAFVNLNGKRYYRTGDHVSQLPSGDYLFLGRLDRQVKRRGFRIELGEIESALAGCENILEAAAVAVEDEKKGTVITAFVRTRFPDAMTLVDAKAHCARTLPLYMVPDHIAFLDAMPKGSRGKIDYLALSRKASTVQHAAADHGDQDRSPAVHR